MGRITTRVSARATATRGFMFLAPILILIAVFVSIPLFVFLILFSLLLVCQSRGAPFGNLVIQSRTFAVPLLRSPPF